MTDDPYSQWYKTNMYANLAQLIGNGALYVPLTGAYMKQVKEREAAQKAKKE